MSTAAKPQIFVLSCERAGSTLLRFIIDTHPQICSPSELYIGALCKALKTTLQRTTGQIGPAENRDARVIEQVRSTVDSIMNAYTRERKKELWCEKTPLNL